MDSSLYMSRLRESSAHSKGTYRASSQCSSPSCLPVRSPTRGIWNAADTFWLHVQIRVSQMRQKPREAEASVLRFFGTEVWWHECADACPHKGLVLNGFRCL